MRNQYKVTLHCVDGTSPVYTKWGESPEHAIKKAKEQHGDCPLVLHATAEEIKDD